MEQITATAGAVQDVAAIGDQTRALLIIVGLAVLGFIGRLVMVGYGDRIAGMNPLKGASGGVFILAAAALIGGGVFYMNGPVKLSIMLRQNVTDPILVSVLGRDSCDPASGAYCVVVFEVDREIVVNWHDSRVHMMALMTPPMNPPWASLRPKARGGDVVLAHAAPAAQE